MPRLALVTISALAALAALVAVACGDRDDEPEATVVVATPTGTRANPTATVPRTQKEIDFGPEPKLGGNILEINPAWGVQVKQAATRTPNPGNPQGLCVKVSFDGTPEYGQWFRLALDDKEVTAEKNSVWIIQTRDQPRDGVFCYAPPEGFAVGKHSAAISVQNPRNPNEPTRQLVAWKFEVIP
jgi:hypothetical protein